MVARPDTAFGKQVGDGHHPEAFVCPDDDLGGGKGVKKDLAAAATWGHDASVAVTKKIAYALTIHCSATGEKWRLVPMPGSAM
ncbi:hypothetical protein SHKM778_47680 [Streptomyces sp. KM77-8]|uniref:Transposase n=1 Tax=Streptomyces haneummycinicus TaxID=3074435 RepID=A0AAT9HLZ4_9ACTN